ncbi:2-vinyl bacteriochlorophyllide hydratase [Prosthecochloris sp. ZM]|uniref:2-vinyl bacteriochlorophyllide hydratase n=1 Tax=unclassified Prosthecochloris TaxID=2632826 RepID=UPI000DF83664|nr:2-vinyl bacteriochlorophyllide hydratase [Prosthecochloris sp.]RDD29633.1 2-vinyl bacteriochlorophyllide hydratase [Prosthecochloris sp. ZM]
MPRYTPEQLAKRNASIWTDIQIILAPLQFFIFLIGVTVTVLYANGWFVTDIYWVSLAILFKTLFFALLFITGAFFEKEIFNKWVYSKEFLWEDVGSTVAAACRPRMVCAGFFYLGVRSACHAAGQSHIPQHRYSRLCRDLFFRISDREVA